MKIRNFFNRFIVAVIATIFGGAVGILVKNIPVSAQSDQKKVSLEGRKTLDEQIKFSQLRLGNVEKRFEEKFTETKGWISRVSFQIENVARQDITYLRLKVLFPETKTTGNIMAYSFSFGNRPGSRIQTAKPFKFEKGATMAIDLAEQYTRIVNFVSERHSIDSIGEIELEASFIVFADGTAWGQGAFMRQDPTDPSRWVQVDMPGYNPIRRPGQE